jgi:hypothetical protein
VDARHAILEFSMWHSQLPIAYEFTYRIESEGYYTVDGKLPDGDLFDPLAGTYQTKDGNWVRIHTNFPQCVSPFITYFTSLIERTAATATGSCLYYNVRPPESR